MRKTKISFIILTIFITAGCLHARTTMRRARVLRVYDGDTIRVSLEDGRRFKVRVLGIDTPESYRTRYGYREYLGKRVSRYVRRLLSRRRVTLHIQLSRRGSFQKGRYRRLLAFVHIDGRDLGERLLRRGYASVYRKIRSPRHYRYLQLERRARQRGLGIWNRRASRQYYRNSYRSSGNDRLILRFWRHDKVFLKRLLREKGY